MASVSKLQETKDGRRYWKISVSRGYGKTPYTTRYYWPMKENGDPVAKRTAENGLKIAVAEFKRACETGEVLNREELKAEQEKAAAEAAKIKTFKQYGEQVFMPEKKITCAEKTREYYQNALNTHLYPVFGEKKLPEITSAQLSAFFLNKQASGLSHSTVSGIYVTANQLFKMAYMNDEIQRNPLDKVKRPRQKKDDKRSDPERYTVSEVKEIKRCLKNEPLRWQALILLLLTTGMRRGEVCALTWDKIDFTNCTIQIDGNLVYTPETGINRALPKTESGNRTVPMTKEVSDILTLYKASQVEAVQKRTRRLEKEHKPLDFKKVSIPSYLFTVKGGSDPIYPDTVNRYFGKFSEKYGIEDFHPHKLRHTAISIMLENGVPDVTVAAVAGHEDASVTNKIYGHASEDGKKAAIETLNSAIS